MSWPLVKLGDVAPAKASKHTFAESDDVWTLNLDQVEADTGKILQKIIAPVSVAGTSTHGFDERHVLYSKLPPYLNKVVLPDDKGLATTELVPMLPDAGRLDRRYLAYYLRSKGFVDWVSSQVAGAKMPRVSMQLFWQHKIPLPPLPEQKRIVAILNKADAIRCKRQEAIQLADDFLRAVFLDMFGDPVTNPKGWESQTFASVGTLDRGKSKHRPRNDPALLGGIHPLIQTGEVANSRGYIKQYSSTYSELGLTQSKKWDAGTLCITIAANIAKTGILTFPACFPDSVVGFIPNRKVTVEFVQHWLGFLQKNLEKNAPQAAQKNINLEILRGLSMPVPPKSEQDRFSSIVASVLSLEGKITCSSDELNNAFGALTKKAFTGQL